MFAAATTERSITKRSEPHRRRLPLPSSKSLSTLLDEGAFRSVLYDGQEKSWSAANRTPETKIGRSPTSGARLLRDRSEATRSHMFTPHDPTHPQTTPEQNRRRLRINISLMAIGVAMTAGAGYLLRSSKQSALSMPNLFQIDLKSGSQLVSGHPKMQAYGPNWSQHRKIFVGPYPRRVASAA